MPCSFTENPYCTVLYCKDSGLILSTEYERSENQNFYKRPRISTRWSVDPSVDWSVGRSVLSVRPSARPSVRKQLLSNYEKKTNFQSPKKWRIFFSYVIRETLEYHKKITLHPCISTRGSLGPFFIASIRASFKVGNDEICSRNIVTCPNWPWLAQVGLDLCKIAKAGPHLPKLAHTCPSWP